VGESGGKCTKVGESGDNLYLVDPECGLPSTAAIQGKAIPARVCLGKRRNTVFVGVHERQLDPKGRLALPASFRPRLEPRCFLSIGRDKCVDILTAEAFETAARDSMEKVRNGEMSLNQQRAQASNTFEVAIDAQGRINIEEKLREYAGLTLNSRVVVSGSFDRVEIWDPERHDRVVTMGIEQIAGSGE
jgi:MraZ protein